MDGTATCYYYYGDYKVEMLNTGKAESSQPDLPLTGGDKDIKVECTDAAGNDATDNAKFSVVIDTTSPVVTKAYLDKGMLNVITDENSDCVYMSGENRTKEDACNFEFDAGNVMSGSDLKHTLTFDKKKTYYVKCRDSIGNVAGSCSIILRYGEVNGGVTNE